MAEVRRNNGWFGGAHEAPSVLRDAGVITLDLSIYVASCARTGFFGPDSWYMNDAANIAYAVQAKNGGALTLPVLFLHAPYDYPCETMDSRFAEPMRRDCTELTEAVVPSGHRMAQEQPIQVNAALAKWLAAKAPDAWLGRRQATGALASGANTSSTRTAYGNRSRKWRGLMRQLGMQVQ